MAAGPQSAGPGKAVTSGEAPPDDARRAPHADVAKTATMSATASRTWCPGHEGRVAESAGGTILDRPVVLSPGGRAIAGLVMSCSRGVRVGPDGPIPSPLTRHDNSDPRGSHMIVLRPTDQTLRVLERMYPIGWYPRGRKEHREVARSDGVVLKPWGREGQQFVNPVVDVTRLEIHPGRRTSLHAHLSKWALLVVLGGRCWVTDGRRTRTLGRGEMAFIARGAPHATGNDSSQPVHVLEIESPPERRDLLRIVDHNNSGPTYEEEVQPIVGNPLTVASQDGRSFLRRADLFHPGLQYALVSGMSLRRHADHLVLALRLSLADALRAEPFTTTTTNVDAAKPRDTFLAVLRDERS